MATYKFGAVGETGLAEGTHGFLQHFNTHESGEEITAKDADGNVALQDVINKSEDLDAEYVFDSETTPPSVGDVTQVGTNYFRVMDKTKSTSNGEYSKLGLQLKRYIDNDIPGAPPV